MNRYQIIAQCLNTTSDKKFQIDTIRLLVKADTFTSAYSTAGSYLMDIDNDIVIVSCTQVRNKFGYGVDIDGTCYDI